MPPPFQPPPRAAVRQALWWRLVPLLIIIAVALAAVATGWHRELSLEMLVRRRAAIDMFVGAHWVAALAAFMTLYAAAVALSIPGAAMLTVCGGLVFGPVAGALAAIVAASSGASLDFLIARWAVGAIGGIPSRWAGRVERLAAGIRQDAFWYLLFLRLVPLFPFWLVNLVPATCGAAFAPFVAATLLGIIPGTFAYAFFGAGLDSALGAQESAYRACLAAQEAVHQAADCRLDFDLRAAMTPELIAGLVALGLIALISPAVRYYWTRRQSAARPMVRR